MPVVDDSINLPSGATLWTGSLTPGAPALTFTLADTAVAGGASVAGSITNTGDAASGPWSIAAIAGLTITPNSGTSIAAGATVSLSAAAAVAGTYNPVLASEGAAITGNPQTIAVSPGPSIVLSSSGNPQTGIEYSVTVTAANLTGPLVVTPENVSPASGAGSATFNPTTATPAPGELIKLFGATWATTGAKQIRATAPGGIVSNTLSVNVVLAPPSTATLNGANSVQAGATHTSTVTLSSVADQTYTITWSRSNGGTGTATSTIPAGQTTATGQSSWAAAGAGRTVDFAISPSITRAGRPLPVTVSDPAPPPPPPPPGGVPQPFTLTSATSGTLPFAIGYAMRQGDVPAGSSLSFSGATAKLTVLSTWPDSSARFGIIAGTYTSAGSAVTVTPTVAVVSAGTLLTGADVQAAMGANTAVFNCGAFGTVTFSGSDFASPFHVHAATDGFIRAIYRKQIGSDPHLVAWLEVDAWAGGQVQMLPWIENGYLLVASPTNKSATYTFSLGGTQRFSAAIDVKHHTRPPLITGSVFSYWLGADPGVTFKHDTAYLQATRLVPNYGFGAPNDATLNGQQQTYTPNTLAGISSSMGVAGSSAALINSQQAHYITSSGDSRALAACLVFGFSGGSWSIHYRDESTGYPLDLPDYPGISFQGGTPSIPSTTGGENGTAVTTHQPSFGYLPYLLTGRWWFLEESQFWTAYNFLASDVESRRGRVAFSTGPYIFANGGAGVIDPRAGTYANRGAHWSTRTLAQTLAITPSTHANFAGYQATWENNTNFYHQVFVAGSHAPGWVSPMGILGEYSAVNNTPISPNGSTAWWGNIWMALFGCQAWGFASNLGLSQSTASANRMKAIRNHSYKNVVDRAGDGLSGRPNWRRFTVFKFPWGTDGTGLPPDTTWTAAQGFAEYELRWSLSSLDPAEGGSLKQHQGDAGSADSDISAGSSAATDYLPFGVSALAYAVEHGKEGAYSGWRRLSSASNWATVTADLANSPGHAFTPPFPSWRPAAGTFANISQNTLNDVRPSGWPSTETGGPFINWVGGQFARDFGRGGALVIHGSGHLTTGTPLFAGVPVFDLASLRWTMRNVPSAPLLENLSDYNSDFESIVPATAGHTYPPHTYDGLVYIPASLAGNTSGKLLKHFWPGTTSRLSVHAFDLDSTTSAATRVIDSVFATGSGYAATAFDEARGGYWLLDGNGNGPLKFVNVATWAVTTYSGLGYNDYGDHSLVYIPSLDCLVGFGRANAANTLFTVYVCPIAAGVPQGFTLVTTSGTKPTDGRCGGQWSEWLGGIICYVGDGATTVQRLKPPTSGTLTGGTWVWQSQTLTGAGGATPGRPGINTNNGQPYEGNGTWGRFVEVSYMPGVFLWASSISSAVQAWHVDRDGAWT